MSIYCMSERTTEACGVPDRSVHSTYLLLFLDPGFMAKPARVTQCHHFDWERRTIGLVYVRLQAARDRVLMGTAHE